MSNVTTKQLEQFLKGVMDIERKYGNELKAQKSARQNELREWLDKFASKELKHETSEG